MHTERWRRHGDINTVKSRGSSHRYGGVLAFFRSTVLPYADPIGCLIWPFSVDARGYPQIGFGGKNFRVHRLACEKLNGPPPPQGDAAHACGNRRCVNPHHTRWATRSENMADCISHGTMARGERASHVKLKEDQVREIRSLAGMEKQPVTAARYGVSNVTISDIQRRRSWAWLE